MEIREKNRKREKKVKKEKLERFVKGSRLNKEVVPIPTKSYIWSDFGKWRWLNGVPHHNRTIYNLSVAHSVI